MDIPERAHRRQNRRAVAALLAGILSGWALPAAADTIRQDEPAPASAEAPEATVAADAATPASEPAKVEIRTGQHRGYSRVVFDWPRRVAYTIAPAEAGAGDEASDTVVITFARAARIDGGQLRRSYLKYVLGGSVEVLDQQTRLTIQIAPGAVVRDFGDGAKVVIDVSAPAAPGTTAQSGQTSRSPSPPMQSAGRSGTKLAPAPVQVQAPAPQAAPPAGVATAAPPATPAAARSREAEAPAPQPPPLPAPPAAAPQPVAAATSVAPRPPPPAAEAVLRFSWEKPVAAAIFRRGSSLWCVFDQPSRQNLTSLRAQGGGKITEIRQRPHERATVLQLETVPGVELQVERDGLAWIVRLDPAKSAAGQPAASQPIVPSVDASTAATRLLLPVVEPGEPIAVTDPEVGDNLVVVPVIPLASRVAKAYDYPQFHLPATVQGIVVQPLIDTLRVRALREAVEISSDEGLTLTASGLPAAAVPPTPSSQTGRVLDPRHWRDGSGSFVKQRQALERAVVDSNAAERESNRLLLAQFLLAHRFATEAQGVLDLAGEDRPPLATEPRFLLLRGASRLLDGRLREASDDLTRAEKAGVDETHLWAEAARAALGEPPRSLDDLSGMAELAQQYPADVREPLTLLLAQAAIAGGKLTEAESLLEAAGRDAKTAEARGQIAYLDGLRKQAAGDIDGAIASFELAERTDPRRARAQAELARIMLLRRENRMSGAEAVAALEGLSFVWRGDATEFQVLRELGRQYFAAGDAAAALRTWKQAVTVHPRLPETSDLTRDMTQAFESLYLDGGADRLPPVTALALYQEFKELTPAGERGSLTIARLADRLVRADLLDQAADLLQGLLAGAPSPVERARLGERLADIRLLNRQPAAALDALKTTAASSLPGDLQRRRALLQARALAATEHGDEALAIIANDDSLDAELVRAKVYRSRNNWSRAAEAMHRVVEASRADPAAALNERQARDILDLAVALTLAGSSPEVGKLDADYGRAMATTPLKDAFRLIAGSAPPPDADAKALAELVEKALAFRRSLAEPPPATTSLR